MANHHQMPHVLLSPVSLRRTCVALGISALVILFLGQATRIDLQLADASFDFHANVFPWRHAWITEALNHVILKRLMLLVGFGYILAAAVDAIRPMESMDAERRLSTRIIAFSAVLVPLAISSLKQLSSSHCPWDLLRYGGTQPYIRILEKLPFGVEAGHCLPAGHASSALWLLSLTVYWLPRYPARASVAAVTTIAFGGTVGILQQVRGAHFMTHTLWSIWISFATVISLIRLLQPRNEVAEPEIITKSTC